MLEPRTNEAAHHPPPRGDPGVAKFGVSAANNSTNIYLLVTHRLRRPAMDETGAELIVSGTAPSAQRSGFAWCEKPVC
jgi:hypothetical protein